MCLMACFPPTFVLFWIQELGTVICQLIWSRLSNTSPGLGRVIAGCRHWLEDESRWNIHFKWEQKMNLMLHIIHIWSDTMLTPVPFTKAVYFVWSDVNIVLKRSRRKKSNKIFLHAGSFFLFSIKLCLQQVCEMIVGFKFVGRANIFYGNLILYLPSLPKSRQSYVLRVWFY